MYWRSTILLLITLCSPLVVAVNAEVITYQGSAAAQITGGTIAGLNNGDPFTWVFSWDNSLPNQALGTGSILLDFGGGRTLSSTGPVTEGVCCEGTTFFISDSTSPQATGGLPAPGTIGLGVGTGPFAFATPQSLPAGQTINFYAHSFNPNSPNSPRLDAFTNVYTLQPSQIPEPTTGAMIALGVCSLILQRRKPGNSVSKTHPSQVPSFSVRMPTNLIKRWINWPRRESGWKHEASSHHKTISRSLAGRKVQGTVPY